MRLNHATARREMKAQRWSVTAMHEELARRGVNVHRTVLNQYVAGSRMCQDASVILGLAEVLNVDPYGLLGPEDRKAAALELCDALGIGPEDLATRERPRHPEPAEMAP